MTVEDNEESPSDTTAGWYYPNTGIERPAGTYSEGIGNAALTECHAYPCGFTCEGTALLFANIVKNAQ